MKLLSGQKNTQLLQYVKRAIEDKDCELEFVYGGDFKSKMNREDFLRVLNILKQKYSLLHEENTLDIIIKDIRTTITGIENIKKYCKSDNIEDIPLKNFIKKTRYSDPKFPSVKFNPIVDYDYNYKINLKSEKEIDESYFEVQSLLMDWKNKLKYFRYKKRYSFLTDDNLFRIDITVVKHNDYNPKQRTNNLYRSFVESGILKNKESYELEIEYVGSIDKEGIFPIDVFKAKLHKEMDEKNEELKQKFLEMKTDWSTTINKGDNVYSELEPYEIAEYEDPYNIPKGINEDLGEFADVITMPEDHKSVLPKFAFEDIKYEYWEDSNREELFDGILMNNKTLNYLSKKLNTDGDYKGSPKHTDYIEYEVFPPFTEDELKDNPEFKNTILVPEKYIVKIAKYTKKISWAPKPKSKIRSGAGSLNLELEEGPGTPRESPPWWKGEDPRGPMNTDTEGPTYDPGSPTPDDPGWHEMFPDSQLVDVSKEWKAEPYIYDRKAAKESIMTFEEELALGLHQDDKILQEELKMRSEMFQRKKEKQMGSDINFVSSGLADMFQKVIIEILRLKMNDDILLSNSLKNEIIIDYRILTEQNDSGYLYKKKREKKDKDKKNEKDEKLRREIENLEVRETRFMGPNPVSISLKNVMQDSKDSIVEGYVVTEKADGIRAQLLINSDKRGYLITPKKEIIGTNVKFENCQGKWLFDGEYITKNRRGDPIKLFMIFDVYYAGDGFSKYPEHAYSYPWISKKKKDISRFSIIEDFKRDIEMIFDETDFRIGFKAYLEGPKKLLKSKKDPTKYSNISGIFRQSKKLWDIETKKSGYEYSIDGLIYMPMRMSVKSLNEGEVLKNFGGEWSINYKWKPPEENTIDFRIRFVKEKDKNGKERDKIISSRINGKLTKCKQVHLYVGYDSKRDETFDYSWKILTEDKLDEEKREILFDPDKTKSHHVCNLPLKDNKIFCEKDKSELTNNQLVEMRYCPDNPEDSRWTPLRLRGDKTQPQFFITANNIWQTIINPVTTEMITGIEDIPIMKEEEITRDNYYIDNEDETSEDISLRKLHNYIKNKLISAVCSVGNRPISIMDTSIGRGGDIRKYLYSKNKIDFLLGLDISGDVNNAAKRFYLETKDKPRAMFIQYDTSESIRDGFGYKGSDEMIERNRNLINIIYNKNKSIPKEYTRIEKIYRKIADKGFDVISSQFTIHYYFKDEMTLRGYLQNLSDNCNKGGYFIGTCYDGSKLFDLLKDKDEYSMHYEHENLVFSIKKDYEIDNFEYDKSNIKPLFGQKINVEMSSIGQSITEYLVNFDLLKDMMKLYKFRPVKLDLRGIYNGIFNKDEYSLEDGIGSFSAIIDNLNKLSQKDTLLKSGGPYHKSLEINKQSNEKLKGLSSLNNWFVFEKI
jgi:hypothetical protein